MLISLPRNEIKISILQKSIKKCPNGIFLFFVFFFFNYFTIITCFGGENYDDDDDDDKVSVRAQQQRWFVISTCFQEQQ